MDLRRFHMSRVVHLKCMNGVLLVAMILCQNALDGNLQRGSGTALDRSLQQGSRVNSAVSQQDYRSRNLVVTGNVAGGREFRGSVGYAGEGDFRAETGGLSTQRFRSNADLTSIESLSSVPMNDRFGVASNIGAVGYRRDYGAVQPGAAVASAQQVGDEPRVGSSQSAIALNSNRVRLDLMTRSSGSGNELSTLSQPMTMAVVPMANNRQGRVIASQFNGVVVVPADDMIESLGLGVYSSALLRGDLRSGRADGKRIGRSYLTVTGAAVGGTGSGSGSEALGPAAARSAAARLNTQVQPPGATTPSPAAPAVRNAYDQIASALSDRYSKLKSSGGNAALPSGDIADVVKAIRASFSLTPEDERESAAFVVPAPDGATPPSTAVDSKGTKPAEGPQSEDAQRPTRKLTADEAYLLLAYGDAIDHLSGGTKEALDILLQEGERCMRTSHFLSAERAFVSAATIAPNNPLPLIGIANSQLAAGLDISAAIAIRQLALTYPETIGARYDPVLLGSRERIRVVGENALKLGKDSGTRKSDYGIVAAYAGYQLADPEMTEQGLKLMEEVPQEAGLTKALRRVWAPRPTANPAPTASDAAPPSK